jgi:two-component system cell cycle sensor histidine kinase/response regulator CckA
MVVSHNSGARAGDPAERRTVLVIDDEPALAAMIARMLEDDYDVKVTSDGRKALALIRMEQPRFDVILCDLMMPNLTGSQVFDQARSEQPGIEARFIFMTGGVFTPWAADFLAKSHRPCLEKPFAYDALRAVVRVVDDALDAKH